MPGWQIFCLHLNLMHSRGALTSCHHFLTSCLVKCHWLSPGNAPKRHQLAWVSPVPGPPSHLTNCPLAHQPHPPWGLLPRTTDAGTVLLIDLHLLPTWDKEILSRRRSPGHAPAALEKACLGMSGHCGQRPMKFSASRLWPPWCTQSLTQCLLVTRCCTRAARAPTCHPRSSEHIGQNQAQ